MQITDNNVVEFHYQMKDADTQELIESSYETKPKQYIHGVTEMLEALESSFVGKSKGDSFDITLPPEQAYGLYNKEAIGRISLKHVTLPCGSPVKGKLKPGAEVAISSPSGIIAGSVIKQGLKMVDVDANHPLAGKNLSYTIEIVDVRAASAEELAPQTGGSSCSCC